MSIVISAFPVLSAREGSAFDRTSAGSTRVVLLISWLGTTLIAAIAMPAAHVLAKQPDKVPQLIQAFAFRSRSGTLPSPSGSGQPCPPGIAAIKLTIAETACIERLARQHAAGLITRARLAFCLRRSRWRRRHQARARCHYSTRPAAAT